MTGPEHYREAEVILHHAEDNAMSYDGEWYANAVANAQVHATLALAAATAEPIVKAPAGYGDREIQRAWQAAIS